MEWIYWVPLDETLPTMVVVNLWGGAPLFFRQVRRDASHLEFLPKAAALERVWQVSTIENRLVLLSRCQDLTSAGPRSIGRALPQQCPIPLSFRHVLLRPRLGLRSMCRKRNETGYYWGSARPVKRGPSDVESWRHQYQSVFDC
jgi:hypothetical protein